MIYHVGTLHCYYHNMLLLQYVGYNKHWNLRFVMNFKIVLTFYEAFNLALYCFDILPPFILPPFFETKAQHKFQHTVLLPLLLFFHPTHKFRSSCLSKTVCNCFKCIVVDIFTDKMYTCYRNGLDET